MLSAFEKRLQAETDASNLRAELKAQREITAVFERGQQNACDGEDAAKEYAAGLEINLKAVIERAEKAEAKLADCISSHQRTNAKLNELEQNEDAIGAELDRVTGERDSLLGTLAEIRAACAAITFIAKFPIPAPQPSAPAKH